VQIDFDLVQQTKQKTNKLNPKQNRKCITAIFTYKLRDKSNLFSVVFTKYEDAVLRAQVALNLEHAFKLL